MNNPLLDQTIRDMMSCEQTKGVSVFNHGVQVLTQAVRIMAYLKNPTLDNTDLVLPKWLTEYREELTRALRIAPEVDEAFIDQISNYLIFHDCGKPYCREVDAEGKVHFPHHERMSYQIWCSIDGDGFVAQCMLHDMDIHRIKGEEVEEFAKLEQAPVLLISGLAEIHANAAMFGGIDSQGFKIKYSQIDRRGRQVCKVLYGKSKTGN